MTVPPIASYTLKYDGQSVRFPSEVVNKLIENGALEPNPTTITYPQLSQLFAQLVIYNIVRTDVGLPTWSEVVPR